MLLSPRQAAPSPPCQPCPRLTEHARLPTPRHSRTACQAAVAAPPPPAKAAPPPSFKAKKVNFPSFEAMIENSTQPVLVDFMATWCGPCQLMSNVLRELAHESPDILVVKIDIDKYPQLATKYRVQGLPTLMLFRDGKAVDRIEGLTDSRTLGRRIRFYAAGLESKFGRR